MLSRYLPLDVNDVNIAPYFIYLLYKRRLCSIFIEQDSAPGLIVPKRENAVSCLSQGLLGLIGRRLYSQKVSKQQNFVCAPQALIVVRTLLSISGGAVFLYSVLQWQGSTALLCRNPYFSDTKRAPLCTFSLNAPTTLSTRLCTSSVAYCSASFAVDPKERSAFTNVP